MRPGLALCVTLCATLAGCPRPIPTSQENVAPGATWCLESPPPVWLQIKHLEDCQDERAFACLDLDSTLLLGWQIKALRAWSREAWQHCGPPTQEPEP